MTALVYYSQENKNVMICGNSNNHYCVINKKTNLFFLHELHELHNITLSEILSMSKVLKGDDFHSVSILSNVLRYFHSSCR